MEPITGYRKLTQREIDQINTIKEYANELGGMIAAMRGDKALDQRWVSIGATDLQTGLMALTRAVAQPTTF